MNEQEKKDMKSRANSQGRRDALNGVTYKQGIASLSKDFLIRPYTKGFTEGLKELKEKK